MITTTINLNYILKTYKISHRNKVILMLKMKKKIVKYLNRGKAKYMR